MQRDRVKYWRLGLYIASMLLMAVSAIKTGSLTVLLAGAGR